MGRFYNRITNQYSRDFHTMQHTTLYEIFTPSNVTAAIPVMIFWAYIIHISRAYMPMIYLSIQSTSLFIHHPLHPLTPVCSHWLTVTPSASLDEDPPA